MYHDTLFRVALLEMAMLNCALSVIVEVGSGLLVAIRTNLYPLLQA